jgi:DNA-binding GntR family transcriptional regulator
MSIDSTLTMVKFGKTVADVVHEATLAAIVTGELRPGDELKDKEWAARFAVSRTPVREAFKRLEAHGLVDVAAARFTRVRRFAVDEAHDAAADWALLHRSIVGSLCRVHDPELVRRIRLASGPDRASSSHASHFAFFDDLREVTPHFGLKLGATAAAYQFRLAVESLPDLALADAALQADVIEALERTDSQAADRAFARWLDVRNPAGDN